VPPPRASVINVGDAYGRRLAGEVQDAITFAVDEPADFSAREVRCRLGGCSFRLLAPGVEREIALPLPGRFNVANALGALAAAHSLGSDVESAAQALEAGVRVPGRLEPVDEGQDFAVLVDYAHTPDSLENVLRTARELAGLGDGAARVLCVFGAGGDRDRGKRPLMGEIAARMSDVAIVTSDNPRSEDPQAIIDEIAAGVAEADRERLQRTPDRAAAIAQAVALARRGDIVLIAGKGHEQGQELAGGRKVPFDDVTVAREALRSARDASVALSGR
jgi:UDP-N-acetylmuramoyl-L-alanyl-D-glutamate--2,6-diaminopimelate ligase